MCGLAGYCGVPEDKRQALIRALGEGIDARGGHGVGFVAVDAGSLRYNRKPGKWATAKRKFVRMAAGYLCMMHSRMATHGAITLQNAHPFAIRRDGQPVLWGAHNGIIYDAEESAKKHERDFTVDSRELFNLLADQEYDAIKELSGYGVITWIDAKDPYSVRLVKMTEHGAIHVVKLKGGGVVWASTEWILDRAIKAVGLEVDVVITILEKRVHLINAADGVTPSVWVLNSEVALGTNVKKSRVTYDSYDYSDYDSWQERRYGTWGWNPRRKSWEEKKNGKFSDEEEAEAKRLETKYVDCRPVGRKETVDDNRDLFGGKAWKEYLEDLGESEEEKAANDGDDDIDALAETAASGELDAALDTALANDDTKEEE